MNEEQTSDIKETFQNHEFVSLPIGDDGTQRAYRIYDFQGAVYCDFVLYRTSTGSGEALRIEVTLLLQNLSQLHTQLQNRPLPLSPPIYCHAITFLGKKAYVLAKESGSLISTRLLPLLINESESPMSSNLDLASISPIHIVSTIGLDKYLADNYCKVNQRTFQADNPFHQLRKSYRTFGLALILLPLLLGLSGVIWGLGQNPLAILTVLIGIFGPVLLTRKAYTAFHRFRLQHSISIPVPLSLIHPLPNLVEPASEIQSQNEAEIELLDEMPIPQIPLTPNTTVAILQNTIGVTDKHNLIILGNLDTEDKGESE